MHIVLLENQKNKIRVEKETSDVYLHSQLVASMTSTINNVERRHWQNQLRITWKICNMLIQGNLIYTNHWIRILYHQKLWYGKWNWLTTDEYWEIRFISNNKVKTQLSWRVHTPFSAAPALQAAIDTAKMAFAPRFPCQLKKIRTLTPKSHNYCWHNPSIHTRDKTKGTNGVCCKT